MGAISRKTWSLSAMAVLGLTAFSGVANAQAPYQYPAGTRNSCNASGSNTLVLSGRTYSVPYSGLATFQTISNSSQPISTTLKALSFSGKGSSSELGEVRWEATGDENSTITANQSGKALPATGRLNFNVRVTVSSQPNALYVGSFTMVNTQILEWPHKNAQYTQEGAVTLVNVNSPSQTMTVTAMTATVSSVQ